MNSACVVLYCHLWSVSLQCFSTLLSNEWENQNYVFETLLLIPDLYEHLTVTVFHQMVPQSCHGSAGHWLDTALNDKECQIVICCQPNRVTHCDAGFTFRRFWRSSGYSLSMKSTLATPFFSAVYKVSCSEHVLFGYYLLEFYPPHQNAAIFGNRFFFRFY